MFDIVLSIIYDFIDFMPGFIVIGIVFAFMNGAFRVK